MTKDEAITELRKSNISNEALMWLMEALNETPKQTNTLDPFEGAPKWARYRAADKNGYEWWYNSKPVLVEYCGFICDNPKTRAYCPDRRLTYTDWRESMVEKSNLKN
jgi:hypothetical protein